MAARKSNKVVVTIPVLLTGGTEFQTLMLVKALVEVGHDVTVCCFYEFDERMLEQMQLSGAKVVLLKQDWSHGVWRLLRNVTSFIRKERPDVVHVQYMAPGFIAVLAARLAGVRTVFATVHQPGRTYGWKPKFLLRLAARICTKFFCISKAVEKSWFGSAQLFEPEISPEHRHCTIYNAIDVENVQRWVEEADKNKLRSKLGLTGVPVIGCVGRLRWEKGQDVLIHAMPDVLKKFPDVRLMMIGDGPDREKLESQVETLGLSSLVIWLGNKSHDDVLMHMGAMDVLAVPSLFEGFGLVAAEAMAARLPVVGSDVDGLAEVIEHGQTGLIVSPSNALKLAGALVELLSSSEKIFRLGNAGFERVDSLYSSRKYNRVIKSIYEHVQEEK